MKIYYLGPRWTYSEEAAETFAAKMNGYTVKTELEAKDSLEEVVQSTQGGDFGIVAYYNRTFGLMYDHLELIKRNKLMVMDRVIVPITFAIGRYPGTVDFDTVYSHPKALPQCRGYLEKNPQLNTTPVRSTSDGANKVKEEKYGLAIAKKEALEAAGLEILAEDIGDGHEKIPNFTDFLAVRRWND